MVLLINSDVSSVVCLLNCVCFFSGCSNGNAVVSMLISAISVLLSVSDESSILGVGSYLVLSTSLDSSPVLLVTAEVFEVEVISEEVEDLLLLSPAEGHSNRSVKMLPCSIQ